MQIHLAMNPVPVAAVLRFSGDGQDGVPDTSLAEWQTEAAAVSVYRDRQPVLLVVGLGDTSKVDADTLRKAAGTALRRVEKEALASVLVYLPGVLDEEREIEALTEGMLLGAYKFDRYKAKAKSAVLQDVYLLAKADHSAALTKATAFAGATNLARDLANEPPNVLRPATLAEFAQRHFADSNVEVTVWDEARLLEERMMGLYAVGKGSTHPPRYVELRYQTDATLPLVALVGKGLTFDAGGISLKSGRDISDMRMDMAGAAAVIGAFAALVTTGAKCNVVGLIVAAENLPDGSAMLPGELIQYRNGVSVQVANTDAEGRLALADALIRAHELGAKYVIDIATLTGAAANALGTKYAAVFGQKQLVDQLCELGEATGDFLWPLPLPPEYESQLKSDYADITNIGKGKGGAITAALFLRHFVDDGQAWAHIDIAGPMEAERTEGYSPAGATGFGVRVMAEFVVHYSSRDE